MGAYFGREPVVLTAVCIAVQTNAARDAPRVFTNVSQYMPSAQPNLLWASCLCGLGVLCFNNVK